MKKELNSPNITVPIHNVNLICQKEWAGDVISASAWQDLNIWKEENPNLLAIEYEQKFFHDLLPKAIKEHFSWLDEVI
tara:strand:+ start:184 stop:417 length:234 start_codon:yes stop_codon:yes gene_type:complete